MARRSTSRQTGGLDAESVIATFSEEQVERLTKLSKRRLRYLAGTGFFSPSFTGAAAGAHRIRLYSFKDIVALRTLELLRVQNGVALQHLRKVAETLSHLEQELWTSTKLYVVNRQVVIVNLQTGNAEEVLTGQYLLPIPLEVIISDTRELVEEFKKRPVETIGQLSRNRNVVRNSWVIAGTRIPVAAIKRLHEDGYSIDRIIKEYPDLKPADIRVAIGHEIGKAA